jgi:heptosyltransferase-1
MTRLLVIKTSSMGDVVHGLVAAAMARSRQPSLRLHWVVEESFADVVRRSPMVEQVHVLAMRRWRRSLFRWRHVGPTLQDIRTSIASLRSQTYDQLIDAQGLIKSAVVNRFVEVRGPRWGFDAKSARERPAAWAIDRGVASPPDDHAVNRLLTLFGQALGVDLGRADQPLVYDAHQVFTSDANTRHGMQDSADFTQFGSLQSARRQSFCGYQGLVLMAHGSSRAEKTWPEAAWQALAQQVSQAGYLPVFPSGNTHEYQRAQTLAASCQGLALAPRPLAEMGEWLASAQVVVGVDSGLTHWAAAMGRPTIGLFLSTPISRFGLQWAPQGASLEAQQAQPSVVFERMQAWLHQDTGALAWA